MPGNPHDPNQPAVRSALPDPAPICGCGLPTVRPGAARIGGCRATYVCERAGMKPGGRIGLTI